MLNRNFLIGRAPSIPLLALLTALNVALGQVEFGGYDSSMLIDLGWRQHLGQQPYKDFPCMLPPSFYLLAHAAIDLFGVHWWSFTVLNSLIWLLLSGLGLYLVSSSHDSVTTERASFLAKIFLVSMMVPLLATNHLWHSAIASQCVVLFLLILYLELQCLETRRRPTLPLFCAGIFAAGMLWLSKPNAAFPALIMSGIFSFACRDKRRFFAFWIETILGGAFVAVGVLRLCHISFLSAITSYGHVSERPSPLDALSDFLTEGKDWSVILEATATYAILIAVLIFILLQARYQTTRSLTAAGLVAGLGSLITLIGICTNWDIRLNDLAPAFFGVFVYLREREQFYVRPHGWLRIAIRNTVLFTLVLVGVVSLRRARMQSVGIWAGDVSGTLTSRHDSFFGFFCQV
ncbi:hypothetical protein [Terriglobus saanensis]|uniref:Glycosyltransferase RgtA/B/C/D-like domain-containing protein n=1 Tax=Terriglobus saanensis (strain ATCC BAA-1853 / DSM 23119 / SP1PR4) TaxID=401053 RepID=E8V2X2_TERSS|nr:hypothetical protein [Terriglobus saanensis]ADV84669.1 hypothetical protein AciPR4_3920 [Terriglobus saanensis SP1PR4]